MPTILQLRLRPLLRLLLRLLPQLLRRLLQPVAEVPVAAASAGAPSGAAVADIPFKASDAIATLLAYSAKVRPDQIGESDTTDTLTNGVSSRRNQLLMDISSELGVASVDGAAEATVKALSRFGQQGRSELQGVRSGAV